jgi:hypothetical protein
MGRVGDMETAISEFGGLGQRGSTSLHSILPEQHIATGRREATFLHNATFCDHKLKISLCL